MIGCNHTPSPIGYLAWHNWADEVSKTHKQVKCESCGLFKIWVNKKTKVQLMKEIYVNPASIGEDDG